MGVIKKSTPRKSEIKVVPDEKDGMKPYISHKDEDAMLMENSPEPGGETGQLSLDVFQTADEIVVVAPIAGVSPDDVNISVTDDEDKILTIRGQRDVHFTIESGDYFTQECFWGSFSRSIILPEAVDISKISASFKNAVLTVRIPKIEKIRTRMVKIKEE